MRTTNIGIAASTVLALLACSAPAPSNTAERMSDAAPNGTAPPPSLYGRWRILEVNGAPARSHAGNAEAQSLESLPNVAFAPGRYGGSSGCNSFGGHGLLSGDRWFAEPPMATQQGCADLTAQENAIFGILSGGPTIAWEGVDTALLRTPAATMRLRKAGPPPAANAGDPAPLLAGTRWELWALDGKAIQLPGAAVPARLTLEADRWTLETPCTVQAGPWRQLDGAITLEAGTAKGRACSPAAAGQSAALSRAMAGRLAYVAGPNGEFVLAGAAHWLTGRQDTAFTRGEGDLLVGEWRILSADDAAPPRSERPAQLHLGPRAFGLWDGCRHVEGVAIVADRQLFTHGSGVQTLASCPRDEIRRKIGAIVAASPRIARAEGGGIALISRLGALRLHRISARPFGTATQSRLRPGTAFDLLTGNPGPARLALGPGDAFTVTLPCGTFGGRWRNARGFGIDYARFSPERPPAGCPENGEGMALYNFFTGDVQAAIGPNGDIALFVNNKRSVPARVAGAGR